MSGPKTIVIRGHITGPRGPAGITVPVSDWVEDSGILEVDSLDELQAILGGAPLTRRVENFKMGGLTPTGVGINFDVFTGIADVINPVEVKVELALTAPGTALFTAGPSPAVELPSVSLNPNAWSATFTGLTAGTKYFGRIYLDDELQAEGFSFTTLPTAGAAAGDSVIVFASCSEVYSGRRPDVIHSAIINEHPSIFEHQGDFGYTELTTADMRAWRTYGPRQLLANPDLQQLLRVVPLDLMPSDHDSSANDLNWDSTLPSGYSYSEVLASYRTVYDEIFPHYGHPVSGTLFHTFDHGRVRTICPDMYSQSRWLQGEHTILGNGTNPPGKSDQLTAVLNAFDTAVTDGIKFIRFASSRTWTIVNYDSYPEVALKELRRLQNKMADCPVPVKVHVGDAHAGGFNDGVWSDVTVDRRCCAPETMASALSQPNTLTDYGPFTVKGVDTQLLGNGGIFGKDKITDDGTNPVSWTTEIKGLPIVDGAATLLRTMSSSDGGPNVITIASGNQIVSGQTLRVRLIKSGFGPYGPCSVDWSIAGTGLSGTVTFKPNDRYGFINTTLPGTATYSLFLSNPVGCTLGSAGKSVRVRSGIAVETGEYFSRFNVATGSLSDTRIDRVDTLIKGLKTDDVWNYITRLHLVGLNLEDALINLRYPHLDKAVAGSGVTTLTDRYFVGDGTDSGVIDTLRSDNDLEQDDQSMFCWPTSVVASGNGSMGARSNFLNPWRPGGSVMRARLSTYTTSYDSAMAVGTGLIGIDRSGNAEFKTYRNGALVATVPAPSRPNAGGSYDLGPLNMLLLGYQSASDPLQTSTRPLFCAGWGFHMTATKWAALYARLHTYATTVGQTVT